ncbi:diacylglycerol kinase [Williamsia deligens]|uniref:Diacylglycerol kinase n=1 Tax=Williamsia deligens TaxID=321325 RepID=A0ABW3G8U0_9NOCA|nr:diacylglycerol kinase [Williamsia deligens]MCP2193798.1 diacylglycerol kinase (ATP) [Williamsia deligens]
MSPAARAPRTIREVVALVNPHSRHGSATGAADAAITALRARGIGVDVRSGTDALDARRVAAEAVAGDADALVVIGGDGTIAGALASACGTSMPVGVIPAGTGNDHARALAVPVGDPDAAADIIAAGHTRAVDLAALQAGSESMVFGTVAAIGLDAAVTERAVAMRWPRGQARYPLAAVAEIARLRPHPVEVTVDDEVLRLDAVMVAVGNTPTYGGGMRVCPDAQIDDGLLDVTVVAHTSRSRLLRLFPTIYRGTHVRHRGVHTRRSRSVSVRSADPLPVSADGEILGVTPVTIDIRSRAVEFLVPAL